MGWIVFGVFDVLIFGNLAFQRIRIYFFAMSWLTIFAVGPCARIYGRAAQNFGAQITSADHQPGMLRARGIRLEQSARIKWKVTEMLVGIANTKLVSSLLVSKLAIGFLGQRCFCSFLTVLSFAVVWSVIATAIAQLLMYTGKCSCSNDVCIITCVYYHIILGVRFRGSRQRRPRADVIRWRTREGHTSSGIVHIYTRACLWMRINDWVWLYWCECLCAHMRTFGYLSWLVFVKHKHALNLNLRALFFMHFWMFFSSLFCSLGCSTLLFHFLFISLNSQRWCSIWWTASRTNAAWCWRAGAWAYPWWKQEPREANAILPRCLHCVFFFLR